MAKGGINFLVFAILHLPFSIFVFIFPPQPPTMPTMRAFVSGQIGVDKGQYLNLVQKTARENGIDLAVCHLGQMMYAEAPDVPQWRILNLPITHLNTLPRPAFKEVLRI